MSIRLIQDLFAQSLNLADIYLRIDWRCLSRRSAKGCPAGVQHDEQHRGCPSRSSLSPRAKQRSSDRSLAGDRKCDFNSVRSVADKQIRRAQFVLRAEFPRTRHPVGE